MGLPDTFVPSFHDPASVERMEYRPLGKTGVQISKLGFGGAALSGFYGDFEKAEALKVVKEALKAGINYVDTAPFYGEGRSEKLLGEALESLPRKSYYISTKVGRWTSKWDTMFDYSSERIMNGFNNSLELLGLDYVDIIVVHDVEYADMNQILSEALPCVQKLKESGKVKYIAVSGYPLSVLWDVIQRSPVPIDVVLTYSRDTLVDRSLYDFIPLFKSKGLGIINAAPTAMAMLTNRGPYSWHPASSQLKKLCADAGQYCKENNVELGRLAVYHTMKNEGTDNFLIGNNTMELLKSNLELASKGLSQKEEEVLQVLYKRFFTLKENSHWEGIEVETYKKAKKEGQTSAYKV